MACQARVVVAVVRHPSLVEVEVGEACLDRREMVVAAAAAVAFQAKEEEGVVHQTLLVAVEEVVVVVVQVEVGTGLVQSYSGVEEAVVAVEGEVEVEERHTMASERM